MERGRYTFRARDKILTLGEVTRIMGVINITPDSFSDGGKFLDPERAIDQSLSLLEAGADMLDLGGESSRPGATPISPSQELDRVAPVLERLRRETSAMLSIDTSKPEVARECLSLGADVINDITSLRFSLEIAHLATRYKAGLVLMHMRGTPETMQTLPPSPDILQEITSDLAAALARTSEVGIEAERIMLDPGLGFGKTFEDNLRILNRLSFLTTFELPVLIGPSRKSFLGRILNLPPEQRLFGTAAAAVMAVAHGAHVVRVHDVAEIRQVVTVADAVIAERIAPC